jgi:pimeloyl-ACP methyl ester carboxylesterase
MGRMGRVMGFVSEDGRRAYLDAYDETLALAPVELTSTDLATPFGSTHVISAGPDDAPPVVVLHGKHCSSTMWLDLLPSLATTRRAHLVDSCGELGRSVAERMMISAGDVALWLDAVLGGLSLSRAPFVGFSNGGFHAVTYATERPERVEAMALLAPVGGFGGVRLSYWQSAIRTMFGGDRDEKWERFWARHYVGSEASPLRQRFDHQFLTGNKYLRTPVRDRLPKRLRDERLRRLTMPVLAVFPDQDICHDGPATAAKVAALLPAARVELLSPSGHFVTFDQLDEVGTLVRDFLDGLSEPGDRDSTGH